MKIAIVGAGFAGVATGRVLLRLKHEVTIFEAAPDVGGVWSKTRSYPGLSTQSPASNHFSDMPWPKDTPFCPTGPQVQAYIEVYVRQFGLQERLHLRTEVVSAAQGPDQRWIVITRQTDESGQQLLSASLEQDTFDHIVICNGPYSRPHLPKYPGKETFDAGGGRFLHSSEFLDVETARGKNILVVGYGKSACDVAVSACSTASSVTVVARKLRWKFPHKILGIVPTHMVLMPRIGEALFLFKEPGFVSRLLNGPLSFIRRAAMSFLQWAIQLRTGVQALGLIPDSGIEHAADGTLSVVTDGFFEGVRDGKIAVLRETSIQSLGQNKHGRPMATLSNGTSVSADLVLAGTGWEQDIPFLAPETVAQIKNSRGDFVLYRWIQPPKVDGLWFNGYAGSLTNASSCEVAALWIAAAIEGNILSASPELRQADAEEWVEWLESTGLRHIHATQQLPFTTGVIDKLLADLGLQISPLSYMLQWLLPLDPTAYKAVGDQFVDRLLARRVSLGQTRQLVKQLPSHAE